MICERRLRPWMSLLWTIVLFGLQGAIQEEIDTCAKACRELMISCEAYSPESCLEVEENLGCSCPACSSDCRRRLNENATAREMKCLGESSCDDGFAALGVTCAFLEEEAVFAGAREPCDCSLSICAQDDMTAYVAPADALCDEYVEDDLKARPCIALTRPATDALVVKNGDALLVNGRLQRWTSSGRRPITIEAGATLEVISVTIDGSSSEEYLGGCVFVGAGSRFSVTSTTFVECKAMASGGAIAAWTGSEISIKKSMLIASQATLGGGLFLYAAAKAVIEASLISRGLAEHFGGCAYVEESASLTFRSSNCNDSTALLSGGGFMTQPGSMLQITGSVVQHNYAGNGGVFLALGWVYAANSTFSDSFASGLCGGLFMLWPDALFDGEDLILRSLSSTDTGGAVLNIGSSEMPPTMSMRRVLVENCHAGLGRSVSMFGVLLDLENFDVAQSHGLYLDASTATISGSVIANCTQTTMAGGCMWMSASVVTMIDSCFNGCTAPRGGAIFVESDSRLVLRAVVISNSVAIEGSGGGALLETSSVLDANNVTFTNCTADDDGGALSVVENSRASLGGASILEGNAAAGSGGAVSVRSSALYVAPRCSFVVLTSVEIARVLTLDFSAGGADIIDNARAWLVKAERHGPEDYFDTRGVLARLLPVAGTRTSLELCLEPATYELWTMSYVGLAWLDVKWELAMPFGDVEDYNETRFSDVGHPALVHGLQAACFKIDGNSEAQHTVRFTGNLATGDGGAVALVDSGRVHTAAGSVFDNNLALGSVGGAISVGSLCAADLHEVEARCNAAADGATMAASTLSTVRLKKSILHANVATETGGGIFAENIKAMELEGLKLVDNTAYVSGGAAFFDASPVVVRDVVCIGNVARGNGGALAAFSSRVELVGVTFERNRAIQGSGGALYVVADSAVDINPAPACARVTLLLDWTETSASCQAILDANNVVTCDVLPTYCPVLRDRMGEDACDGCACHDLGSGAENYFEVIANEVLGTGRPRAKSITEHEFCLSPNPEASPYRVSAYDDVRGHGWFSGKLHVAVATEQAWYPAVEDFSFEGNVGHVHFQVVEVPATTTRFIHNVAGSGGGAIFQDADTAYLETLDSVGNTAGYGDILATPAVNLELQVPNVTLTTASAIPFHVSAKLLDAKGQLVSSESRLVVDVHWSADVDGINVLGTRNTTLNGVVDFDLLTFMAPVGVMCRMYLESDTMRTATINVFIVPCPPGYEEELRNDVTQCSPCRPNYYWHEGKCRACVDGMSCQDDGAVPLEHRVVGDMGALALKSGYHRQSVYSHRPVRCDGGKSNPACRGGIDSVGCNTKKFVLNKPRCQVCKTGYFRRGFRCQSCSQVRNSAFITTTAILALLLVCLLAVIGPLVVSTGESRNVSVESEATIRFARALSKVQTKYKALFVALQLWSVLLTTSPVELPPVTSRFLEYFVILSVAIPGNCFMKGRFTLYNNLLAWTTAPFALVAVCVFFNTVANLVRSVSACLATKTRIDGHEQRPYVKPVYQNFCHGFGESASRMRRSSREDTRLSFSRRISDSSVALSVIVIVAFLCVALCQALRVVFPEISFLIRPCFRRSYPPMAYVVLSFFVTDTYDDPHKPNQTKSYSHFDPAVRAEGPTYIMYRIYAGICVATHVVGIPAFFALCLHRVRDRLDPVSSEGCRARLDPKKPYESRARCAAVAHARVYDPELRALRPLWFVYLPQYFNFEVFELLRRMVMMTLPKLVSRRPMTQIGFTCVIAYASTRLYNKVRPFLSESDCEFFENIQWLTLILGLILLYIAADQQVDQLAGYAIIFVFLFSVIHATASILFDIRQEEFVVHAMKEYMAKLRVRFRARRFSAMSYRPNILGNAFHGIEDNMGDLKRGDAVKESTNAGENDAVEFDRTVTIPKRPSKVANVADEPESTLDEIADKPSHSS